MHQILIKYNVKNHDSDSDPQNWQISPPPHFWRPVYATAVYHYAYLTYDIDTVFMYMGHRIVLNQ